MNSSPTSRLIIGCGYLGRRVAQAWVDEGDNVFALTRSGTHADEFQRSGIQPVIGDVLTPSTLTSLPSTKTVLYAVGYDRSSAQSKRQVYVEGLQNILNTLPDGLERFVYISSTSVYGQSSGEEVDESSPCEPMREGGKICLEAERHLSEAATGKFDLHVLRLSGIYGPDRLIGRREQLENRQPFTVNPDGWLNLIHVDDAVTTVLHCADHASGDSPLTIVSDDHPMRRREFYETLASLFSAPAPTFVSEGVDEQNLGKRCCNRRLREQLGIELQYPTIETGLPQAIERSTS